MNEVLVAGHICLDIIPEIPGRLAFEPGHLIEVGPARISTGGAVSNTGLALHKLGIKTGLAGKIGDDMFGQVIRQVLEKNGEGLSEGLRLSPGEASSYTIVINLTGEDRMFLHAPGCNDTFVASDISDEALANTKLLHFGYPTLMAKMFEDDGSELVSLFSRAKAMGVTTSLDVSLPDLEGPAGKADWFAILARVLPYTDLFLPSAEEIQFMLAHDGYASLREKPLPLKAFGQIAQIAIAMGAKIVGIKAGSQGLYVRTREDLEGIGRAEPANLEAWKNRELFAPVFKVDVKGTTGAGDSTIAGLLMGWTRGMSPEQTVRAAAAVGASCCEQPDAVSGVRSWEETSSRLEVGWEHIPTEFPYIPWNEKHKIYSACWVPL